MSNLWEDYNMTDHGHSDWIVLEGNDTLQYVSEHAQWTSDVIISSAILYSILTVVVCILTFWKCCKTNAPKLQQGVAVKYQFTANSKHGNLHRKPTLDYKSKNRPTTGSKSSKCCSNEILLQYGYFKQDGANKKMNHCNKTSAKQSDEHSDHNLDHDTACSEKEVTDLHDTIALPRYGHFYIGVVVILQAITMLLIAPLLVYKEWIGRWLFGNEACNLWVAAKLTLSSIIHWSILTLTVCRTIDISVQHLQFCNFVEQKISRNVSTRRWYAQKLIVICLPIVVSCGVTCPVIVHLYTSKDVTIFNKCIYSLSNYYSMYHSIVSFLLPTVLQMLCCVKLFAQFSAFKKSCSTHGVNDVIVSSQSVKAESPNESLCDIKNGHNVELTNVHSLEEQVYRTYIRNYLMKYTRITIAVASINIILLTSLSLPYHIILYRIIRCGQQFCVSPQLWTAVSSLQLFSVPMSMAVWLFDTGLWKHRFTDTFPRASFFT